MSAELRDRIYTSSRDMTSARARQRYKRRPPDLSSDEFLCITAGKFKPAIEHR
jgi:hypothetical protein